MRVFAPASCGHRTAPLSKSVRGYGGLEPGARYLALQELCDTITECIVAIESMLPQNRAATDAGVN